MKQVKSKKGLILFFGIYGALLIAVVVAVFAMLSPLRQKLSAYEAAQLENQSEKVFAELFFDPDWEKLYELSGTENTLYEGKNAYAAYMESKVGSTALTYREVHTTLHGIHQYHVFLGEEKIAAFALKDDAKSLSDVPRWTLDGVEIFFERTISVTVEKKPEYTVYINGVALDDTYTLRTVYTKAEEYLPEGIHGYRLQQQCLDGLLIQPEVLVLDQNGETVEVNRNEETGIYTLQLPEAAEMTEAERTVARDAAVADARFSMGAMTAKMLAAYFDASSQVYSDIVNNPISMQKHKSFSVDDKSIEVSEYFRYSDELFSARVKLTVNVIRKDNTLKLYHLDKTYFFSRSDSGVYLAYAYTNEPVQEPVEQVRLVFVTGEERVGVMVDRRAGTVSVPEMAASGDELVGWATRTEDDSDTVVVIVHLMPDGTVLGELEPMTLYPVFQSMLDKTNPET